MTNATNDSTAGDDDPSLDIVIGNEELIAAVEAHVERHIGLVFSVFHEIISELIHIDVFIVRPTLERNYYTLVTCGMSAKPMPVDSEEDEDLQYAELMLRLPPDWPLEEALDSEEEDPAGYWPVHWMKLIARLPHERDTLVAMEHTFPNGADAAPFEPNTNLGCWMLMPPITTTEEFWQLEHQGHVINFYAMVALHPDEMEAKLADKWEELTDGLDRDGVSEILEIDRPSIFANRKRGLFGRFRRKQ